MAAQAFQNDKNHGVEVRLFNVDLPNLNRSTDSKSEFFSK
jgi:hypothetical protein